MEEIAKLITPENPEWIGSPTGLAETLSTDMRANVLTLKLNVNAGKLLNEYGIRYEYKRCHEGRRVKLTLVS